MMFLFLEKCIKTVFAVFFVCLLLMRPLQAQTPSIDLAEQHLKQLQNKAQRLQKEISVRQARMEQILNQLDKRGNRPVKSAKGLSKAFTQSSDLTRKKRDLAAVQKEIQAERQKLYGLYGRQIDSLQQKIAVSLPRVKKKLQLELFRVAEKRWNVSPLARRFSFNPQKIAAIHPSQSGDSLERAIWISYIQKAVEELDRQITLLNRKKTEMRRMQRLREKTESFLSDVADNQLSAFPQSTSPPASERTETIGNTKNYAEVMDDQNTELQLIWQQLQSANPMPLDVNKQVESDSSAVDEQTLLKRMTLMIRYLQLYRRSVLNKLHRLQGKTAKE